jgi:mono/diheme cytochrome c family protein
VTIALFILLGFAIIMELKNLGGLMNKSVVYFLCVVSVIGLGYFGGQLVFADNVADASEGLNNGGKLYAVNCGTCHPNGGNLIKPSLPVVNSPMVKSLDTFTNYSRNPKRPDNSPGSMPAISKDKLSDKELKQIYQYISDSLAAKRP